MIPLAYSQTRWILGLVASVIIILLRVLPLSSGGLVGFIILTIASVASALYPPGIYFWLVRARCPQCSTGKVEWFIEADGQSAYQEVMGARCQACDWEKIEYEYRPDYGPVQPRHDSEHH